MEIYEEERPWGSFRRFTKNAPSTVKVIKVKPGEAFSLQTHSKRNEFWRITAGAGTVEIGDKNYNAKIGDEYIISKGERHRMTGGPSGVEFLEIAEGDFDEEDITRLEDKYGRV
jgi:mannose-6-phosphate isomerase